MFENEPRVLSLSLKMTPHVCLEMTLIFLGQKMMSLCLKMTPFLAVSVMVSAKERNDLFPE